MKKTVNEVVYQALIGECEHMRLSGKYVGDVQHLAQRLAQLIQDSGQLEVVDPEAYSYSCGSCGHHDTVALFCAECETAFTNEPLEPDVEDKMRMLCGEFAKNR